MNNALNSALSTDTDVMLKFLSRGSEIHVTAVTSNNFYFHKTYQLIWKLTEGKKGKEISITSSNTVIIDLPIKWVRQLPMWQPQCAGDH